MTHLKLQKLLVAVALLPACGKKPADKATPSTGSGSAVASVDTKAAPPPPPAAATTPFEGSFEGKTAKLTNAKIYAFGTHDRITLSSGPLPCDGEPGEAETNIDIDLDRGPGGMHFAPGPFVAQPVVYNVKTPFAIGGSSVYGVLTLDNTEWKAGNKVKGTLRIDDKSDDGKLTYTGSGTFEATVCDVTQDPDAYAATPAPDKAPATGTFGGKPFTMKSAIAELGHDDKRNVDEIKSIQLFDSAVDCTSYSNAKGVSLQGSAGASGKDVFLGAPQRRELYWAGADPFNMDGPVYVTLDAVALEDGGEVKGSVFAQTRAKQAKEHPQTDGKLNGTFVAKVCKL